MHNEIQLFQVKKEAGEHDLKVATIFSYQANQQDEDAQGFIPDEDYDDFAAEPWSQYDTKHTRDKLEEFIADYNGMFKTNYSTNEFYSYYKDIGKRVKNRKVDILLVVNMFLTGFDSKLLNTIYVDKNLKYHGLIQAYSRTNRILDEVKSQGNVVAFRNLKEATDEAITLFSNKQAIEEIIVQPYEDYIEKFDEAVERAGKLIAERDNDLSEDELKEVAHKVGIGAVKYADLSKNRTTDYMFNWDSMLSFEGNTAPYLQYAYTRVKSLFRKAGVDMATMPVDINIAEKQEHALAVLLMQFEEVIGTVSREATPHVLCTYLYDVASAFMSFYEACPMLKDGIEPAVRDSRLALSALVAKTLEQGLTLLGIETLEKM